MPLKAGTLFVVATPIGNLEDITARALRVLREVSLIAAEDTRRTARLLQHFAIETPMTSLHAHNEFQKSASLVPRLQKGESLALVSDAGTPTVSDPGQALIRAAIKAGLRVEAIPGANAALAALAASGLSDGTFMFLGFPPPRGRSRREWFGRLLHIGGTIVFFEAPHRILTTLQELGTLAAECEVCVARELTKLHEEFVRGPISDVIGRLGTPRGEYTIVIKIGHAPHLDAAVAPAGQSLINEIGRLTDTNAISKRDAIAMFAKRYGKTANEVYDLLVKARESVE